MPGSRWIVAFRLQILIVCQIQVAAWLQGLGAQTPQASCWGSLTLVYGAGPRNCIQDPTKAFIQDPCPFGLPEILTGAHIHMPNSADFKQ